MSCGNDAHINSLTINRKLNVWLIQTTSLKGIFLSIFSKYIFFKFAAW